MLKVNNRNTKARREICSKLTIKTPERRSKLIIKISERRYWRRPGIFLANFEHISHLVLMFLLLTLSMEMPAGSWLIKNQISKEMFKVNDKLIFNL